jgi:membrane peptidoglycan carboxypeptidase
VVFNPAPPPEEIQVVNAGSVWLLQSIMTDCTARRIIWGCGGSNNDTGLDFFMDGTKIPAGVKTGTQQGPKLASDTLETWTTGFTRHAGTAVWVGNATNELVNDRSFAAANATLKLYKNYMGMYHSWLVSKGVTDITKDFSDLRPKNVAQREFESPTTSTGLPGGCDQKVTAWVRTDVTYESECEEKEIDTRNGFLATDETPAQFRAMKKFVKLPAFKPEPAIELAKEMNIPIAPTEKSNGSVAVGITNLSNGKTVSATTQIIGTVNVSKLKNWKLEIGQSSSPSEWKTIGSGTENVNGVLGTLDIATVTDGVYTVRLSTDDGKGLSTSVLINIRKQPGSQPSITPQPGIPGATPTRTATTAPGNQN